MKPFLILLAAGLLIYAPVVQAQDVVAPEDEYFDVYTLIQRGENLQARGKDAQAHTNYVKAETALKKLREDYPLWQRDVVKYRLDYLASKVAATEPTAKPGMTGGGQKPVSEIITPGDPSEPVTIKIKWQVGKRYLMTVHQGVNAEVNLPGQAKPVKQSADSTLNLVVDVLKERDGGGEELELQDLGAKTGGGAAAASPLGGVHIKYLTDANGKIESVEDFEGVRNQLAANVPAEMQDAMKKTITENSLKDMVALDDGLPDKPVKSGDTWSTNTDMGLPGSSASDKQSVEVKYTLVGWTTHDQQKCAVIEFAGDKDESANTALTTAAGLSVQSVKLKGKIWFNPDQGTVAETGAKVSFTLQKKAGYLDETTGVTVAQTDVAK